MKHLLAFLIIIGWSPLLLAQTDSVELDKKSTLTLSSLVSSNANYYGQTAEEKLPFAYLDLRWQAPWGWYISGGGYQLITEDDLPSEMHLSTGFEFEFNPSMMLDVSYTRSFYAKESPLLQASNPNSATAAFGFTHLFKTELTADFNFGKTEDFFVALENTKQVKLAQWGQGLFYVNPGITVVAGTQRFYTTYIEERGRALGLDHLLPLPALEGMGKDSVERTTVSSNFNLLSYSLNVPFIYYWGKNAVMLSYQLSLLSKKSAQERRQNSFFSLGYFYQF